MTKTQTWNIGSATVTRIEEMVAPTGVVAGQFLSGVVRERFERHLDWLAPAYYDPKSDRLITSNHSWLIRSAGRTVLVDACAGNHKERSFLPKFHQLNTPFLDRLKAAGAAPEDIDMVLCTHLHADHVGWNTRLENGRWVPTFPKAKYLFTRVEAEFWTPDAIRLRGGDARRAVVYEDSVSPVIAAGQAELIETTHDIDPRLLVRPAPGHTPGQVRLDLRDGGRSGVFCGDTIHHPIQVYEPTWNAHADEQPDVARATRRELLERCADSGALLFPTHFAAPHVVAIERGVGKYAEGFVPKWVSPGT